MCQEYARGGRSFAAKVSFTEGCCAGANYVRRTGPAVALHDGWHFISGVWSCASAKHHSDLKRHTASIANDEARATSRNVKTEATARVEHSCSVKSVVGKGELFPTNNVHGPLEAVVWLIEEPQKSGVSISPETAGMKTHLPRACWLLFACIALKFGIVSSAAIDVFGRSLILYTPTGVTAFHPTIGSLFFRARPATH